MNLKLQGRKKST